MDISQLQDIEHRLSTLLNKNDINVIALFAHPVSFKIARPTPIKSALCSDNRFSAACGSVIPPQDNRNVDMFLYCLRQFAEIALCFGSWLQIPTTKTTGHIQ